MEVVLEQFLLLVTTLHLSTIVSSDRQRYIYVLHSHHLRTLGQPFCFLAQLSDSSSELLESVLSGVNYS